VRILCAALQIYSLVIVARIVLEWIPVTYDHPVARIRSAFRAVTEPLLAPIRAMVPTVRLGGMGLDLSPIILILAVNLIAGVIC